MPWGGRDKSWTSPWSGRNTPWKRGFSSRDTPWGNRGFSSRDMPWDDDSGFPFFGDNKYTDKFFDRFDDFDDDNEMREFFEDLWDDSINAPYDMGEMPGGARAPTLSVPGPAAVADELQSGTRNFFDDNRDDDRRPPPPRKSTGKRD